MADYLTTDTELTSIANAIRTKGGTSASLTYPTGFVTAIGNIPTGTARASSDLEVSGATVTAPAGLYASAASKSVASGTAGTPTATKGTVNNHSVSVTPSVTNTTGYITGSTKTGTAVTVSASELVSGIKSITANGTGIDVTNYAAVDVAVSGGGGTSYKALIVKNGTYGNINITHNSTTYTTAGDYFYFSQGDIITIVQNFGDSNDIYIDGVKVESAYYSGASYNYTAPDHDILIAISGTSSLENFGKTEVTEDSTLRVLKPDSLSADANATYTAQPGHAYSAVTVNVPTSGNSKNVQVVQGTTRTVSSSMSAIGAEMTVSKTGKYDVYWSAFRSTTSGSYTYATQLYVDGSAYGSENSTWTNHVQNNHLSNVSLMANQKIRVYGRESRSSSYYIYAPTLVIVES